MAGDYIDLNVYVDLDEFDDCDILDEIRNRVSKRSFLESLVCIDEVKDFDSSLVENLSSIHNWNNQETAKEFFESLRFSKSLKEWILRTYGKGESLEKAINLEIQKIEDSGYTKGKVENVEINAPLALMQVEAKAKLFAYKKVLQCILGEEE
ncbi:hypothetical protein [uncultured Helicobacter sp.]|uniref:hypothetical protein n=1 Tax=uncultured Helicobacter sp. TaxID=175537 RepID=UPI0026016014|nr:hypothetical protein [uncultured Helicobacter sp.]